MPVDNNKRKTTGKNSRILGFRRVLSPFHLAIPVSDVDRCRDWYRDVLGCKIGREDPDHWCDLNFFGHQVVLHKSPYAPDLVARNSVSKVDADAVPVPHFGLCLTRPQFDALARRVQKKKVAFVLEPKLRFAGTPGSQHTMFFFDPCKNALEFKSMTVPGNLFKKFPVGMKIGKK